VAVKLIKRGDLSLHRGDALVVAAPDTLPEDVLHALDDRYGKGERGISVLKQWVDWVPTQEGWTPGMIMPLKLGVKENQLVIFCCVADAGERANYAYIRQCLRKIADKRKELEINRIAMLFIGCSNNPEINEIALEPVIAAAVGDDLQVDLYQEFNQGAKGYES